MSYLSFVQGGLATVSTAATSRALTTATTEVKSVTIQAERSNTGTIYVGDSNVVSTAYGVALGAGDSVTISGDQYGSHPNKVKLSTIYLDTSVNGDGVSYFYLQETA